MYSSIDQQVILAQWQGLRCKSGSSVPRHTNHGHGHVIFQMVQGLGAGLL